MNDTQSPLRGALEFANAIEQAREIILSAPWYIFSPTPKQELAAAEKQLKHQILTALDEGFTVHDPNHPEFRVMNQHNQYGLYNPDNKYYIASISTDGIYIIRGKRGTSASLEIQIGSGEPGYDENLTSPITISQLSDTELNLNPDGSFEIIISDTEPDSALNWLCNQNDKYQANSILIRESFMDWEKEKGGTWYIEREDMVGLPNLNPSPKVVNDQYKRASEYLINSTKGWVKFVDNLRAKLPLGILPPPKPTQDGSGLPGQWNAAGLFPMTSDDALIITFPKSNAKYQSIQIGDLWFNALEFCHRQTSLTATQAQISEDEKYQIVISAEDPKVANWLDTAGTSNVFVFMRWQGLPDGEKPSGLKAEMVKFKGLRKHLSKEPRFSAMQRQAQLAARKASALTKPRGF
jgi:hypothetical protein